MATDLDRRIRGLIDTAAPITIEEISDLRRRSHGGSGMLSRVAVAGLALATIAAGALLAVNRVGSGHNRHTISVTSPPATSPPPRGGFGAPLPGCTWTGDKWAPSAPAAIQAQGPPQGFWECPATIAQAEQLVGTSLATPQIPHGWSIAYQTVSGVGSTWLFNRTWTPDGRPPSNKRGERMLQLRIRKHPAQGAILPDDTTLGNGDPAHAGLSIGASYIDWIHDGVDYGLGAAGLNPAEVLAAANSLP